MIISLHQIDFTSEGCFSFCYIFMVRKTKSRPCGLNLYRLVALGFLSKLSPMTLKVCLEWCLMKGIIPSKHKRQPETAFFEARYLPFLTFFLSFYFPYLGFTGRESFLFKVRDWLATIDFLLSLRKIIYIIDQLIILIKTTMEWLWLKFFLELTFMIISYVFLSRL